MRCRGPAALGLGAGLQAMASALIPAPASAAPLGVLLDYAAGVLQAADLCSSGALGAIRYVSDRRPGGAWMLGKRIQLAEARDLYQNGLKIVSCSQFRKQDTADCSVVRTREWSTRSGAGSYIWPRGVPMALPFTRRSMTTPPMTSTRARSRPI